MIMPFGLIWPPLPPSPNQAPHLCPGGCWEWNNQSQVARNQICLVIISLVPHLVIITTTTTMGIIIIISTALVDDAWCILPCFSFLRTAPCISKPPTNIIIMHHHQHDHIHNQHHHLLGQHHHIYSDQQHQSHDSKMDSATKNYFDTFFLKEIRGETCLSSV